MWQKDQRGWDCYTMSDMDRWYCRGKGYLPPRPIRKLWQPPIKMSVGQFSWLQEFPSPPPSPGCRTTSVNWVQCAPKTEPLATLCVRDAPSSHLLKIEGRTILLTSVELDTQFLISYSNQNPPTPTNKAAKLLIRCQDIFYLLLFHSDIFKIPTPIPKKKTASSSIVVWYQCVSGNCSVPSEAQQAASTPLAMKKCDKTCGKRSSTKKAGPGSSPKKVSTKQISFCILQILLLRPATSLS